MRIKRAPNIGCTGNQMCLQFYANISPSGGSLPPARTARNDNSTTAGNGLLTVF
jgi:hypothetical protein